MVMFIIHSRKMVLLPLLGFCSVCLLLVSMKFTWTASPSFSEAAAELRWQNNSTTNRSDENPYVVSTSAAAIRPNLTATTTLWEKKSSPTAVTMIPSAISTSISSGKCIGLVDGLGYVPNTGLFNQCIVFLGLVLHALEKKVPFISKQTLGFFSSWNGSRNDVKFETVFNATAWNEIVHQVSDLPVPNISECEATDLVKPRGLFDKGYAVFLNRTHPLVCPFWRAMQPVDAILDVARTVRPNGTWGVLHPRIENDLRGKGIPPAFWKARIPLAYFYSLIRNYSDHSCLDHPKTIYMCVMAEDVTEIEDKEVLDHRVAPWPDARLILGGSEAMQQASIANGQRFRLYGAVLDFEIARSAPFFIGRQSLSTFARSIMTLRTCLGFSCNIDCEISGLRPASY